MLNTEHKCLRLVKVLSIVTIVFMLSGCATWDKCGWYYGSYVYDKCQKGEEITTFDKIMFFIFNESMIQSIAETIKEK